MTDLTSGQLVAEYMGREGGWIIHRPDGDILIPITVLDVKAAYGRVRLLCQVANTNQSTWIDTAAIDLLRKETDND